MLPKALVSLTVTVHTQKVTPILSYLERTSSMLRTHSQGMQLDLGEDSDFLSKDSDFSLPIRILPK